MTFLHPILSIMLALVLTTACGVKKYPEPPLPEDFTHQELTPATPPPADSTQQLPVKNSKAKKNSK